MPRLARAEGYPSTVIQVIVVRLANTESDPGAVAQITVMRPGEDVVLIISQIHRDAVDRHDSIATIGEGQLIGIERCSVRRDLGFTVYGALVGEAACA